MKRPIYIVDNFINAMKLLLLIPEWFHSNGIYDGAAQAANEIRFFFLKSQTIEMKKKLELVVTSSSSQLTENRYSAEIHL